MFGSNSICYSEYYLEKESRNCQYERLTEIVSGNNTVYLCASIWYCDGIKFHANTLLTFFPFELTTIKSYDYTKVSAAMFGLE